MKYTHAKFLHTLGATLALGSMAIACGADAPPPPASGIAPATTGTVPPASTTGAAVPTGTGAAVPTSTAPVPPPATGTPTTPVTTPTTAPTDTVAPTTTPTVTGAPTTEPDRPMPGQPTVGTPTATTPTMMPTGGTTVPPDVLPTMTPEEEEDPPVATGEGNALVPTEKLWIAANTNGVGVVGSWYEFHDAKSSDVAIAAVDGVVCLTGAVAVMADAEDYDTYGAGMGLNLNNEDPWDGSAYGGVSFTAEVTSNNPVEVRFPIKGIDDGKEHYVELKNGSNSISWSDLEQKQWVIDEGSDEAFDAETILGMQIAVVANLDDEGDFSVCISDLVVDE
jgi:hypothetical protein